MSWVSTYWTQNRRKGTFFPVEALICNVSSKNLSFQGIKKHIVVKAQLTSVGRNLTSKSTTDGSRLDCTDKNRCLHFCCSDG